MLALQSDKEIDLIHKAKPSQTLIDKGAYQRSDGVWVYDKIKATDLWNTIMQSNYDYAEPGILFEDTINQNNNLRYTEYLSTTNPCGEVPLPYHGCCDLGPIILPKLVINPFQDNAKFDFEKFKQMVSTQVRFLDNVLDVSNWALAEQKEEALKKRRIGVGFTGLANAICMLGKIFYSDEGLCLIEKICIAMRDSAYNTSIELAKEKGSFPLLNIDKYLEEGTFASRLPDSIKDNIRLYGIRNSHLLSIAPTGSVSLAFGDNCSNGLEPPFSLAYTRKKRTHDGFTFYNVLDHGFRVWLSLQDKDYSKIIEEAVCKSQVDFVYNGNKYSIKDVLPKSFVTALEMSSSEHLITMAAVQKYIDASCSKTINCPENIPFEDFKHIYTTGWELGLKGLATFRPNNITGSVLSVKEELKKEEIKMNIPATEIHNDEILESRPKGYLHGITLKIPSRFITLVRKSA
jgi:ribonucleoside-diphosphate reductase alpha chain